MHQHESDDDNSSSDDSSLESRLHRNERVLRLDERRVALIAPNLFIPRAHVIWDGIARDVRITREPEVHLNDIVPRPHLGSRATGDVTRDVMAGTIQFEVGPRSAYEAFFHAMVEHGSNNLPIGQVIPGGTIDLLFSFVWEFLGKQE